MRPDCSASRPERLGYRDAEVDMDHPLRQVFGELPPANVARLRLRALSLDAVSALVGDAPLDPEGVLAFTGGNPLFVLEVVATSTLAVPASVQDAVLARVASLSADARLVAEFVAIHPGGVGWPLIDAVVGSVAGALREGTRRGLLRVDDDGVGYRHEVQRRAVETSLAAHVRRDLHRRVLAELDGDADPALLVHHARGAGDDDALVAFAPLAARAAMAAGSHREALAHFRALGLHLDRLPVADAAGVAEDWVRTAHHFGYPDDAVAVLPRAIELRRAAGDPCALARTLSLGVMVFENVGRPSEADAFAAEAVEILDGLPPGRELAEALTEQARLQLLRGRRYKPAIETLDRAVGVADAVGDDRIAASALALKGAMLDRERDPAGVSLIEQAHARAARGEHRFEQTNALMILAGKAADVRDLSRALDYVERARSTAVRYELRSLEYFARAMRAGCRRRRRVPLGDRHQRRGLLGGAGPRPRTGIARRIGVAQRGVCVHTAR